MSKSDQPSRAKGVPSFAHEDNDVTFMIVSAAGSAVYTYERAEQEIKLGRRVNIIPTPNAARWLGIDAPHQLTGWPIRPAMRIPLVPTFQPPGDAVWRRLQIDRQHHLDQDTEWPRWASTRLETRPTDHPTP